MDMRSNDRRGLGEITTWACVFSVMGIVVIIDMVLSAKYGRPLNSQFSAFLIGAGTAFIARGTQSAAERSGSSEAMNKAVAEIKQEAHAAIATPPPMPILEADLVTTQDMKKPKL